MIQFGVELALKYKNYSLEELIKECNITVQRFEGGEVERLILGYIENDIIYVNIAQTQRIKTILEIDIENIVIAHELFHFLEHKHPKTEAYNSETQAHLFAQYFLDLEFSPEIIQTILLNFRVSQITWGEPD